MSDSRAEMPARREVFLGEWDDSRGVVRLYAMTLADGVWTLTREEPDFTPLEFRQRFTGTFSEDGGTITGAWEKGFDGGPGEHDFALTYRRVG